MAASDGKAFNLLSGVLNEALVKLEFRHGAYVSRQRSSVGRKLAEIVLATHDAGVRDPDALVRVAVASYASNDV